MNQGRNPSHQHSHLESCHLAFTKVEQLGVGDGLSAAELGTRGLRSLSGGCPIVLQSEKFRALVSGAKPDSRSYRCPEGYCGKKVFHAVESSPGRALRMSQPLGC